MAETDREPGKQRLSRRVDLREERGRFLSLEPTKDQIVHSLFAFRRTLGATTAPAPAPTALVRPRTTYGRRFATALQQGASIVSADKRQSWESPRDRPGVTHDAMEPSHEF